MYNQILLRHGKSLRGDSHRMLDVVRSNYISKDEKKSINNEQSLSYINYKK